MLSENTDNMQLRIGKKNVAHADYKNMHHPSERAVFGQLVQKRTCGRKRGLQSQMRKCLI